jgi:hypothetical protein
MYYLNCDVTAVIDNVKFTQVGKERVELSGISGQPPPRTTKVGVTAFGGYTAELHWALIAYDIPEKIKMAEVQMKHRTGTERMKKFLEWTLTSYGSVPLDPQDYNSATVDMRLVAQAKNKEDLSWDNFAKPALEIVMQSWPAATTTPDKRQAVPQLVSKPILNCSYQTDPRSFKSTSQPSYRSLHSMYTSRPRSRASKYHRQKPWPKRPSNSHHIRLQTRYH